MPASHLHKVEVEATLYKLGYLPPLETYNIKKKKQRPLSENEDRFCDCMAYFSWIISETIVEQNLKTSRRVGLVSNPRAGVTLVAFVQSGAARSVCGVVERWCWRHPRF